MSQTKLPVFRLVYESFRIAAANWLQIIRVSWPGFLVYLLVTLYFTSVEGSVSLWTQFLLDLLRWLIEALILAPMAIAIHRLVLLGESAASFTHWLNLPRLLKYTFYSFLVVTAASVSFAIPWGDKASWTEIDSLWSDSLLVVVVFIAAYIMVKFWLVLPAVSTGQQGFGLLQAYRHIKGNSWRFLGGMVAVSLLILLPFLVFSFYQGFMEIQLSERLEALVIVLFTFPIVVIFEIFVALVFRLLATENELVDLKGGKDGAAA